MRACSTNIPPCPFPNSRTEARGEDRRSRRWTEASGPRPTIPEPAPCFPTAVADPKPPRWRPSSSSLLGAAPGDRPPLAFEVTYTADVRPGPISARVYVMLEPAGRAGEPRHGLDWFQPQPFFAVEARDWKPGEPLHVGADAVGFPGPLDRLEPGEYAAQAVVRLNPDTQPWRTARATPTGRSSAPMLDPEAGGTFA